jgi:hypothetical protein
MAFPQVAFSATSFEATNVSTHNVIKPVGTAIGQLIIFGAVTYDGGLGYTIDPPSGFTELYDAVLPAATGHGYIACKVADGSEGVTLDFTTSGNTSSAHWAYSISGHDAGTPPEVGTAAGANTHLPDSPSLNPAGWGTEDTLWVACNWQFGGAATVVAYPTNYGANNLASTDLGNVGVAVATRELASASEDPGTMELNLTLQCGAQTIAIRPSGAAASKTAAIRRRRDFMSFATLAAPAVEVFGRIFARSASGLMLPQGA